MKPFEDARLRLNRAKLHGERLAANWNEIPPEELYSVESNVNPDGTGSLRLARVKPVSDDFSLLLGEMLYHLRASLDACLYQAAIYTTGRNPPPDEQKLEFPICSNKVEFPAIAKRRLSIFPQQIQDAIERIQPYNIPTLPPSEIVKNINRSLSILNDLARKDRHRKLHLVGAWAIELDPVFDLPEGVIVSRLHVRDVGFLENDNELANFQLKGYVGGMRLSANPRLLVSIGLNEPPLRCDISDTFDRRLEEIINAVHSVITAFENYY